MRCQFAHVRCHEATTLMKALFWLYIKRILKVIIRKIKIYISATLLSVCAAQTIEMVVSARAIGSAEKLDAVNVFQTKEPGLNENQARNAFTFFIERQLPSLLDESAEDLILKLNTTSTSNRLLKTQELHQIIAAQLLICLLFQLAFVYLSTLNQRIKIILLCSAAKMDRLSAV